MRGFSRDLAIKRYTEGIRDAPTILQARDVFMRAQLCNALKFEDLSKIQDELAKYVNKNEHPRSDCKGGKAR
jgi:hypothetical protein